MSLDEVLPFYYKSKKKSRLILNYLREDNIGHTRTHLSGKLNIHSTTLKKYLDILEKYGFVIKEIFSNKVLYFLSD